jgi:N6-L-threonylcarbamoyladenine synthase
MFFICNISSQTLSDAATADLCASFQSVAISHVVDRLKHAINYVQDNGVSVTALVVVGGVAANKELRRLDAVLWDM